MTGYGKVICEYNGRHIAIEIRSLNSKQADLNVRVPSIYRSKEMEMRSMLTSELHRGKIDLNIQRNLAEGESSNQLNEALVKSYHETLKTASNYIDGRGEPSSAEYLNLILKMPDVLTPINEELEDGEYAAIKNGLIDCIKNVKAFRSEEGKTLEDVVKASTQDISSKLVSVEPFENERIERIKSRINASLTEDGADSKSIDEDRLEQEMIYYLEKLDISEEKVRLKAHCEHFLKTLTEDDSKGKKLGFISQEMGREINTLGSKAQHSDIQHIVVGMKDELEKIKEQVLNIL